MGLFGRDSQQSDARPSQPARTPAVPAAKKTTATTVAQGCQVEGSLAGSADILIQGEVRGSIASTGQVVVAESGSVHATIRARSISVAGRVKGDLTADDVIQLEPGGVVHGDLTSPRILIKDGANLQGQVEMSKPPPTAEQKTLQPKTKTKSGGRRGSRPGIQPEGQSNRS